MPIDYEHLMSLRSRGERVHYTARDVLLYALGVGRGRDPDQQNERPYLAEPSGLKTLPSFASVLVSRGASNNLLDDCGWDASRVEPREEAFSLDRPLDDSGTLLVDTDVVAVLDKGAEAGALITVESRARRESDGQPVFTVRRAWLAGGDGGFGGPRGSRGTPHMVPQRRPDMTETFTTRPDQALLFRLSADQKLLYPDLVPGPRLPGLCLQGIACHAILQVICAYDHTLIRSLAVSYGCHAYPGETLVAELWQDANIVSCRLRAPERDALVLDQGRCVLAD